MGDGDGVVAASGVPSGSHPEFSRNSPVANFSFSPFFIFLKNCS